MSREQLDVINYPLRYHSQQVSEQSFELYGFTFDVTYLEAGSVWHVTGLAHRPDGTGDGTLINLVLPGWHNRGFIVDLVEKTIVQHVNHRK